jgi:hypothetical protein
MSNSHAIVRHLKVHSHFPQLNDKASIITKLYFCGSCYQDMLFPEVIIRCPQLTDGFLAGLALSFADVHKINQQQRNKEGKRQGGV